MKRGVTDIVTPGLVYNEQILNQKENNYLASLAFWKDRSGFVRLYGESEKSPETRLNEKDKRRKINYQHYTGRNWGTARNYDICLDSSTIGVEECANIIVKIVNDSKKEK